ncbi:hypothetical protein P9112_003788 [Eukaryota sp. TZLM1-RC]
MCKSFNIEAFIEPLVRKLSSDQTDDSFVKRRADLVAPGIDGVLNVVDVVSVDVCKNSAARLVYSADSPLSNAEKKKIKKYEEPLAQLGRVEHVKYHDIWIQCFPQNVQEIPTRSLPNLRFCLKKLQHHLVKLYEGLDYEVRLGLAKTKNPAFGNFLKDIRDSSAAALVTQVPSVYGILLKNNEWLLNMRFRCFLWPNNLPNHLTCKCGKPLLFTHLLNCKHFIMFRSKVHNNNVRDQIYVMCKSYRVDSFLEPLLSKLILDDPNIDSTRYNRASMGLTRGDLVVPGLNGSFTILDAMSIDPCNSSYEHFINSDVNNPLLAGEKYKIAKYAKPISSVNENSHAQYNLCPFVFSLLGSLGKNGRIFNRVPAQLSPLASIPFAVVLRAFTENLRKGLWDVTPIWKLFLKKDKKLLSKKSNFKKNVFSKEKLVRKLALKGRFGSAKQCLFSSDLAECNESTLFQLNHLHPEENFHCTKPDSVDYWLQNPVNASEVLKLIQQMPTGKAPGPSLLNFDMIKSAVGQCPEIADDLVLFFNNLLTLKIKSPF